MMEVESRFLLTPESKAQLLEQALLLEETHFTVEFLDTIEWKLAYKNLWLKRKNGKYELKTPSKNLAKGKHDHLATVFNEISDQEKILAELGIEDNKDFEAALSRAGIKPFTTIKTVRTSYMKDRFRLDLDQAQFPLIKTGKLYHYEVAEIELQVPETEVPQARADIITFANEHGLEVADIRGKCMESVFQNYPKTYQEFVKRGLISK